MRQAQTRTRLSSAADAAASLGVSVQTLALWHARGEGPRAHSDGASVRYDQRDIDAWLDERARRCAAAKAARIR